MDKINVGITGQAGFVGTHLYNEMGLYSENINRISFEDSYFDDFERLKEFVNKCDVIIHLAAMNRHPDPEVLYKTNIELVNKLLNILRDLNKKPLIIFSSSTQEVLDNPYGKSKIEGRKLFEDWAYKNEAKFAGFVIPNVYGPFCKPNYNSFVATFSDRIIRNEEPKIIEDNIVKLIYVSNLCKHIINYIYNKDKYEKFVERVEIPCDFEIRVSEVLQKMKMFRKKYIEQNIIPNLCDTNDINLFNTFCSYLDIKYFYPIKLKKNEDQRGAFIETIRSENGGQVSFSTTKPGVTRGNHYHTRKVERFIVINGSASIKIRKIGDNQVIEYKINSDEPAFVDIPVWYTHNITNIGKEELYTQFWINEFYNEEDPDTFYETV